MDDDTKLVVGLGVIGAGLAYYLLKKKAPEYPKTISIGKYSFIANNITEEKYLKEFLGIYPPGLDIDTYLANSTNPQLNEWKSYWIPIWTSLNRSKLVTFTSSKYSEYYNIISAQLPKFDVTTEDDKIHFRANVKNTGTVGHDFAIGISFFRIDNGDVIDFPWVHRVISSGETISDAYHIWNYIDDLILWPIIWGKAYDIKVRVWKRYTPGTHNIIQEPYFDPGSGAVYGETPWDGKYLDEIVKYGWVAPTP